MLRVHEADTVQDVVVRRTPADVPRHASVVGGDELCPTGAARIAELDRPAMPGVRELQGAERLAGDAGCLVRQEERPRSSSVRGAKDHIAARRIERRVLTVRLRPAHDPAQRPAVQDVSERDVPDGSVDRHGEPESAATLGSQDDVPVLITEDPALTVFESERRPDDPRSRRRLRGRRRAGSRAGGRAHAHRGARGGTS